MNCDSTPVSIRATICGVEELDRYQNNGVTHVLSILDPVSLDPEALMRFPSHARTTLRFHDEIDTGPGIILPQREHIAAIVAVAQTLVSQSNGITPHLLVHCQMGISRSTAAAAILLAVFNPEEPESEIFSRILALRDQAWPNCRMIALADELLQRHGRMSVALGRLYAKQLTRNPAMGDYLRANGRGREVDMAMVPDELRIHE